jgi:hypothetical protein
MAGMFSWLTGDDTSALGGMPDRMDAAGTPMNIGIFGNTFRDDPGALPSSGSEAMFGPLSGSQKTSLLFAGLRDMANSFAGNGSNYLSQQGDQFYKQNQRAAQKAANTKIQQAYATGDMNKVRAAIIEAAGAGSDISHITDAFKVGRPDVRSAGNSIVSIDPLSGNVDPLYTAPRTPPAGYDNAPGGNGLTPIPGGPADPMNAIKPPPGFQWANPQHTSLSPIPGYIQGVGAVSAARRAPKAAGANAPIALPHPGSLY